MWSDAITKRFVLTVTLAAPLVLGYSGKADAQIIYGTSFPTTNGMMMSNGMMSNGPVLVPGRPVMTNTFSPSLRGVMVQPSIGPNLVSPSGFNRFDGLGFNSGFFQPNPFGNPFFGDPFGGFNRMSFMGMGPGMGRWHR